MQGILKYSRLNTFLDGSNCTDLLWAEFELLSWERPSKHNHHWHTLQIVAPLSALISSSGNKLVDYAHASTMKTSALFTLYIVFYLQIHSVSFEFFRTRFVLTLDVQNKQQCRAMLLTVTLVFYWMRAVNSGTRS